MNASLRPMFAEFLGTALFVFIGAGSVVANAMTAGGVTPLGIALAHGVGMAILISSLMGISGGHLNPAVSLGVFVAGRIDGRTLGRYVLAQLVGGIAGAALLKLLFASTAVRAVTAGAPQLSLNIGFGQGIAIEAVFTFFLVSAVFGTAISSEAPKIGGFGIGLAIFVSALVVGGLTGAALNPARAFGPALVAWSFHSQAVYWIGPLAGGALAGWVWRALLLPKK
ncbi:MAG TPA: aquaporin [Gemmatimonadales bacterium]|nr:aquaporin [Gemmatimonadales bacterium]